MAEGYGTIGRLAIEHPLTWERVTDNVYLVRSPLWGPTSALSPAAIYIGTVVVVSGDELLVVDPGLAHHPETYLLPFLARVGFDPTSIRVIVNSHDHFDHVLGNLALRKLSGAPVAAHPKAEVPGGVDVPLADGELLHCGDVQFQVIHTPGHSPTAICLWWEARRLLICGDAVQGNGDYSQGLPILTDIGAYQASLDRLQNLHANHLVTAHLYRYQPAPVLHHGQIGAHIKDSIKWCELYEGEIRGLLRAAQTPITRAQLHARLVEAHAWHPEEAKLFTTQFLSAWSRPTIEAYLEQCMAETELGQLVDEGWPDVGELAESDAHEPA